MKLKLDLPELDTNDLVVLGVMLVATMMFVFAAVYAMAWSVKSGQFENFNRSAQAIFDSDEPIGQMTDGFPGEPKRSNQARF
jgi:cbb3-type cytochrome oxidase maturation protein